jgi:lipopolysaccharide biosynthesis glycosyltransferase
MGGGVSVASRNKKVRTVCSSIKTAPSTEPIKHAPHMTLDKMDQEESGYYGYCETLIPAFPSGAVTVCMVSSDEYAPFAAVAVQSVVENATSENNYDLVILSDDMSLRNRWRIEKIAEGRANISMRIIDISRMVENFSFYTWAHFTSKTYYRLLIPDLFSAYEKVIYLDSDVVVNRNLAELFETDLGDNLLAAAYDTHVVAYCSQNPPLEQLDYNIQTLGLKEPEIYFQAGVSIFNIKIFRENYESGYLIKQGASHKLRWLDQDLINMLCQGKIKRLRNKWNVMIANKPDFIDEYYLPQELRKEYFEARKDPYIIHYVGRAMPCYTTSPDLYEYFWKYARQTVFYEILLQRMCEEACRQTWNNNGEMQTIRRAVEELQLALHVRTFKGRIHWLVMLLINIFFPVGSKMRNKIRTLRDHVHVAHSKPK